MVHKEAIMNIDNTPPRLTWEQAQAVLEKHVHNRVSSNDSLIEEVISILRSDRHPVGTEMRDCDNELLGQARCARTESRELLATLNTMMRGV